MIYKFELGHNTVKATKNICCVKDEGTVDYNTVTKWMKKFCSVQRNLNNQATSDRPKTMDSEAILQAIEGNPTSNTWRVSGNFSIS